MAESASTSKFTFVNHTDEIVDVTVVGTVTGSVYSTGTVEPNLSVHLDFGSGWVLSSVKAVHLVARKSGSKFEMPENPVPGEVWRIFKQAGKIRCEIFDKKDNAVYVKNGWSSDIVVKTVGYVTSSVYDSKVLRPNEGSWISYCSTTRRIQKELVIEYGDKTLTIPNTDLPENNGVRHIFHVAYGYGILLRDCHDNVTLAKVGARRCFKNIRSKEMAFSCYLSDVVYQEAQGDQKRLTRGDHKWDYNGKSVSFEIKEVFEDNNVNKYLLAELDGVIYLAFKGTSSASNLIKDVSCTPSDARNFGPKTFLVHAGIWSAVEECLESIKTSQWFGPTKYPKIVITGHSLGGGMGITFAGWLYNEMKTRKWLNTYSVQVYTFGAPQVLATDKARKTADETPQLTPYQKELVDWLNTRVTNCVFGYDIVPTLPLRAGDPDLARFIDAFISTLKRSAVESFLLENETVLSQSTKEKVAYWLLAGSLGALTCGYGTVAMIAGGIGTNTAIDMNTNVWANFRSSFKKTFLAESCKSADNIAVSWMGGAAELKDLRKYISVGTTYLYQWNQDVMWELDRQKATQFYYTNIFQNIDISAELAWQCKRDHSIGTGYATAFGGSSPGMVAKQLNDDFLMIITGCNWSKWTKQRSS